MTASCNYLHQNMPNHFTTEDKCKRYALLLHMTAAGGLPRESSVDDLIRSDNAVLDNELLAIDADMVSQSYMRAAEKYRISRLAPAFIDIIECLNKIDTPMVKKYLDDRELKIIVHLYKQVLGLSEGPIDLNFLDLTDCSHNFMVTLKNLFQGQLDIDHLCETSKVKPRRHYKKPPLDIARPSTSQVEYRRQKNRSDQRIFRMRHMSQERERSRLAQRRSRMLQPDLTREKDRIRKKQWRVRKREQEGPDRLRLTRLDLLSDAMRRHQDAMESEPQLTQEQLERKQFYLSLLAGLQANDPGQQRPQPPISVTRPPDRHAPAPNTGPKPGRADQDQ